MAPRTPAAADAAVINQLRAARGVAPSVLALDLSLTATGVAAPVGGLATIKVTNPTGASTVTRIAALVDEIVIVYVDTFKPDLVVIEELIHNPRISNNAASAMIHGVLRDHFYRRSITYTTVPPASLKKYATGKGNATKPDMRMALYQRTGIDCNDDNQVDAAWLRLMTLDAYGHPEIMLPALNRAALDKVNWPNLDDEAD